MNLSIVVKLQVEGIHHWPGCNLEEVKYLKHPHRHMFHITVEQGVQHGDRETEIICLKHALREHLHNRWRCRTASVCDFRGMSCETIATGIMHQFPKLASCEVLEDGENGAKVTR